MSDLPKYFKQSVAVAVKIEGVSKELASGTRPCLERRPYEGLKPKIPLNAAGFRLDPWIFSVINRIF